MFGSVLPPSGVAWDWEIEPFGGIGRRRRHPLCPRLNGLADGAGLNPDT
jgi:hypothetical protein